MLNECLKISTPRNVFNYLVGGRIRELLSQMGGKCEWHWSMMWKYQSVDIAEYYNSNGCEMVNVHWKAGGGLLREGNFLNHPQSNTLKNGKLHSKYWAPACVISIISLTTYNTSLILINFKYRCFFYIRCRIHAFLPSPFLPLLAQMSQNFSPTVLRRFWTHFQLV